VRMMKPKEPNIPTRLPTDWHRLHGDALAGRRVLVTGGAGFIGSHLAAALLELGVRVIIYDDLSAGTVGNLRACAAAEFVEGSVTDADRLTSVVRDCDIVFHLAAIGSVPRSLEQPRRYHDVNVGGTLNLLEAARQGGVRRVVFAASSSAYGDNPVPWHEGMPPLPRSPYAATKVAGEALMRAYSASFGMDTVCLRYFNIFGPRQNAASAYAAVIAAFAQAAVRGERPVIYGDGLQARDFTYVDNAVHANLLAARHAGPPLAGRVLNVGCGASTSINHLAERIPNVIAPEHRPARHGDVAESVADLARIRATLNYTPIVPFDQGLAHTLAWYREMTSARPGVRAA